MQGADARSWLPDRTLFLLVLTLLAIGLAMVYSASTALTLDLGVSSFHFLIKQAIAAVAGMVLLLFILKYDYRKLAQPGVYLTLLGASMAMLVLVLFMPEIAGTNRWFRVAGFGIQPSEFAKIALIVALAAVSSRWQGMLTSWGFIFLTLAAFAAPTIFLIAVEPDLGTAAVLTLASFSILFAAGIGMRKIFILVLLAAVLIAIFIVISPYRWSRIQTFMDPTADPLGRGFQASQSEIALGAGGVVGVGYMGSRQKLFYLPAAHSDFIFAVIGEEWGLIGAAVVLFLYLGLFARGIRIAFTSRELFGFLLATGITVMIVGQALINMSVASTLFPTKGITLPLVSYGGSSVIGTLIALGLLLNISQYCRKGE